MILGGIFAFGAVILAISAFGIFHRAPSCVDGTQNQNEDGIDCGGPCAYLCTAMLAPPSVRFALPLSPVPGRVDVIAYVDNLNATAAARRVPFTIELENKEGIRIASSSGMIDLPPKSLVPIFIPGFPTKVTPSQVFLTIAPGAVRWFSSSAKPVIPHIEVASPILTPTPRVTATVSNVLPTPTDGMKLIAVVYDVNGTVIAASQTLIAGVPAGGSVQAIFTWPTAFSAAPGRIEVVPVSPLSTQ